MLKAALTALTLTFCLLPGDAAASCVAPGGAQAMAGTVAAALNANRRAMGLPALREDRRLTAAAAAHGCDMAANGFFDHRGSDGSDQVARAARAGYGRCWVAENLAWGYREPDQIITGWLTSPGHREIVLRSRVSDYGLSVVEGPRGPLWVYLVAQPC